jgi:hypothetical protein
VAGIVDPAEALAREVVERLGIYLAWRSRAVAWCTIASSVIASSA